MLSNLQKKSIFYICAAAHKGFLNGGGMFLLMLKIVLVYTFIYPHLALVHV